MRIKTVGWASLKFLFAIFTGGSIIGCLIIQAFDYEGFSMPSAVGLLRIIAAVLGIWIGRLWKEKCFLIMASLLIYQIIRLCYKDANLIFTSVASETLINGIWVIAGCYSLGRIYSMQQLKRFLRIFLPVFILGTIIHCCIALYSAWIDQRTINLSEKGYWGLRWAGRLRVSYLFPNTAGAVLSITGLITLLALLEEKRKNRKILYAFAFAIMIITLSLTDSRTSFISVSAGISIIFGTIIYSLFKNRIRNDKQLKTDNKKKHAILCISIICMIIIFGFSFAVIVKITPVFNAIRSDNGIAVSTAKAEEMVVKREVSTRGLSDEDVLNGRVGIWRTTIIYLFNNPKSLLFGESIYNPMEGPNQLLQNSMGHCHNMFLQILLESGIVGIIIVFLFSFITARNAIRNFTSRTQSLWLRLIPVIPISILIGDLAECFGWFYEWKTPVLPFLFIACGIINSVGGQLGKKNVSRICSSHKSQITQR